MQRDVELLPCPFCGNKPLLSPKNIEGGQSINCAYCPGLEMYSWIEETDSGHIYMSEDELVKRWNTRTKQPTNLVGLDIGKLLTFAREYWKDKPLLTEGDSFGDNDFVRFLDLICSRFGQRTVELLSVEEIYAIINSYKMFDKFTVNGISQRIHSAMLEKIGEKK